MAKAAKSAGLAVDGPFGLPVPDVARLTRGGGDPASAIGAVTDALGSLTEALGSQFPTLGALTSVIPRDTLAHRLSVLAAGCEVVNAPGALESIEIPALCVVSSDDLSYPAPTKARGSAARCDGAGSRRWKVRRTRRSKRTSAT